MFNHVYPKVISWPPVVLDYVVYVVSPMAKFSPKSSHYACPNYDDDVIGMPEWKGPARKINDYWLCSDFQFIALQPTVWALNQGFMG